MSKRKLKDLQETVDEKVPKSTHNISKNDLKQEKRLIIILEHAQLELVKGSQGFRLKTCDLHTSLPRGKSESLVFKPEIVHKCLLDLMDHPLNRAGLLQVFVHTTNNILIEINPQTRIPRTFKRFAGLMVQLLQKFFVRADGGDIQLLKVIKNPITDHLPTGIKKFAVSSSVTNVSPDSKLVPKGEKSIAYIIGATEEGTVDVDYVDDTVAVSNFPITASGSCMKLCKKFSDGWKVFEMFE